MKERFAYFFVTMISIFLLPLAACATDYGNKGGANPSEVKYSVDFLKNGGFVVRNSQGKQIEGRPIDQFPLKLPNPVTAVNRIETVVELEGSCILIIDGRWYPC